MTTLLAVDDSTTMRKVIEITFAGEDFDTVLASSASEAMERLYQASPAVALVDVSIGNDDGYELCQRIKGELPQTRVLLVSSKHNPFDAARAAAVGADDHIDKPFDTQSMIDKVRELASASSRAAVPAQAPPIQPAPAPIQPAAPSAASQAPSEPPVLEPESPVMVDPEEIEAVTIEPPAGESAPPAAFPAAPSAPAAAASAPPASPAARSAAPAAASGANGHSMQARLSQLGLTPEQVQGVLALSKEVVEQAVWEVVPALAETLIKEEIARLTK